MSLQEAKRLMAELEVLQDAYPSFTEDFLPVCMAFMGFTTTEIQKEIAWFVEHGPKYMMVQACRGIAKTTILACYAVWLFIHDPNIRVLIVTSGQSMSSQISTLIIRLIMNMEELECLRPNMAKGDRTSVENFDVNTLLRTRVEKSPSLRCVGIGGSITGNRADLLLSDDIEDPKNSQTAGGREILAERSLEFVAVSVGRIIYLGTPQSIDSVYNGLPSRGFDVRIWPGRYPTQEQLKWYGPHLAPSLAAKLQADPSLGTGGGIAGDQGKATDTRIDENELRTKELAGGSAWFQLHYMLNTSLADADRYPLRTEQLVYERLDGDLYPSVLSKDPRESGLRRMEVAGHSFMVSSRMEVPTTAIDGTQVATPWMPLQDRIIYIDPAGGGTVSKDETAFADLGLLNSNLYLLNCGGIPGGYDNERLEQLAKIVSDANPNRIVIEKNYGNGAFKEIFLPVLRKYWQGEVRDHTVHGQKEKRINGILGPIMGRGALCVSQKAIDSDTRYVARYPADTRKTYSLFFQMSKMTLDKDSLLHDDRLDALAGAAAQYVHLLVVDQQTASQKAYEAQLVNFFKNPTNKPNYNPPKKGSLFNKYLR